LLLRIKTDACHGTDTEVKYLEHVQAVITANASRRGDLELFLTSPMGTRLVKNIIFSTKTTYHFSYFSLVKDQ
jgi:subtilisin-like proprotein convertase family protein